MEAFWVLILLFGFAYLGATGKTTNIQSGCQIESRSPFGTTCSKRISDTKEHTTIRLSDVDMAEAYIDTKRKSVKNGEPADDYPWYHFIPKFVADLMPGKTNSFESDCFKENTAKVTVNKRFGTASIVFDNEKPSGWFCSDLYLITTNSKYFLKFVFFHGNHEIDIIGLSNADLAEIEEYGFHLFWVNDEIFTVLPEIWSTLMLFLNWKHIFHSEGEVLEFLGEAMDLHYKERPKDRQTQVLLGNPTRDQVKSGDTVFQVEFNGVQSMIMYASGTRSGHMGVALWDSKDELWLVESTLPLVTKTKWKDWLDSYAKNGGNNVLVPLKEEYSKKFDEKKAWKFFNDHEGNAYGLPNFLFGAIDTLKDNIPPQIDVNFVPILFALAEQRYRNISDLLWGRAMMHRLGMEGPPLSIAEFASVLEQRNMTFAELMMIVEQDEWLYNGKPALVCSSFVAAMYKDQGFFDPYNVQATEITPRDLYEIGFYQDKPVLPEECKADGGPHCQLTGKYYITLPDVGIRHPYDHMYEACPGAPPSYARPLKC